MTDLAPTGVDNSPSVELNPGANQQNASGYKLEEAPEKKEKPLSAREALEKASNELKPDNKEQPKPDVKEAKEPKAEIKAEEAESKKVQERDPTKGKFASKAQENTENPEESSEGVDEAAQEATSEKPKSSEGRGNREPPARFLPRERDEWIKAPNIVRDAVQRITGEYEKEITEAREATENWKALKRWDDLAKQRGVTLDRAMEHYVGIDTRLQQDLVGGLDHIARQYGYDLRTVAQHVLQQPADQHQAQLTQQNNQLQQAAQQLQQQAQQLQTQLQQAQQKIVELETIQPFVSQVGIERYRELEPYIANFLNSGMIPSNLSGQQKLETAFDMAERLVGRSQSTSSPAEVVPDTAKRVNPAGKKSIKGPPTSADFVGTDKGKMKPRDAIKAAMAELGINQ